MKNIFELDAPKGTSIAGHLLDLGRDPLEFLTDCGRNYGDINSFTVRINSCLFNC